MKNRPTTAIIALAACCMTLTGCGNSESDPAENTSADRDPTSQADASMANDGDHGHSETPLGPAVVGEYTVECAQGHGEVAPGKEMHLVVKLPFNDQGATVVRAWIGSEDRLQSRVAKGDYAASHDDYDVHAEAPDPLPEGALWWIEIERPDGSKHVGSCRIL